MGNAWLCNSIVTLPTNTCSEGFTQSRCIIVFEIFSTRELESHVITCCYGLNMKCFPWTYVLNSWFPLLKSWKLWGVGHTWTKWDTGARSFGGILFSLFPLSCPPWGEDTPQLQAPPTCFLYYLATILIAGIKIRDREERLILARGFRVFSPWVLTWSSAPRQCVTVAGACSKKSSSLHG